MSNSADLSFRAVALARKLLGGPALDEALAQAEARGVPLGRYLVEAGRLSADAARQVEGIRARWGRTCSACQAVTYLLPQRSEADTPCERCGGALTRPSQPASTSGRQTPATPARRPAPAARRPDLAARPAPARAAAPPAAPPPALVPDEDDDDDAPPLPEQIGTVRIESHLAEDEAVFVYAGVLGEAPVAVRVLRPERAQRPHELDAFQRASAAAVAAGLEPLEIGHDALNAPFLVVRREPGGEAELARRLLALAPRAAAPAADPRASSDTGTLIFERLQKQRQQLLHDVAKASRQRDRCVGRFVLLELLAYDGGQLWRGFDTDADEVVAVRVFPWAEERLSPELEEALVAAARPRHPHVLQLREHGLERGRLFLVREHVPLQPLEGQTLELVTRRAVQAAQGLAYLHGLSIVHGGIHPGSAAARGDGTPALTELGVAAARAASDAPALPWRLVRAGCAPPESADGRPDDPAGDVFALGAVIFRAAAAWLPREPLAALTPGATPAQPDPAVDLLAVLMRCLASDPAARYPGALELARDLERVQQGQLPQARQPNPEAGEEAVKPASVVATLSGVFKKLLRRGQ